MQDALPVRKEFDIRAPSAPQLELRLHWFGRALEARSGYIVQVKRRRHLGEHVASIAYEMPLPRYELKQRSPNRHDPLRYDQSRHDMARRGQRRVAASGSDGYDSGG
jgi:hypothetical protein